MVLELQNNGTQVYNDEAEGELHPRLYISYSNYPEGYRAARRLIARSGRSRQTRCR